MSGAHAPVLLLCALAGGSLCHAQQRADDATAVQRLAQGTRDPNRARRVEAVQALGRIGPAAAPAAPALVRLLAEPGRNKTGMPHLAARALVQIGAAAIPALTRALSDTEPERRFFAARALGRIGPAAACSTGALVAALERSKDHVERELLEALGRIGPGAQAAVPALIARLDRSRAAWAISRIGKPAVIALIAALRSPDRAVREAAARTLGRISPAASPAAPALLRLLRVGEARDRVAAIEAMGGIGPAARSARPALLVALGAASWRIRLFAAEALGRLGQAGSIPALSRAAIDDIDDGVARFALEALAALGLREVELAAIRRERERRQRARILGWIERVDRPEARRLLIGRGLRALPFLRQAALRAPRLREVETEIARRVAALCAPQPPGCGVGRWPEPEDSGLLGPYSQAQSEVARLIWLEQDLPRRKALLELFARLVWRWPLIRKTPRSVLQIAMEGPDPLRERALEIAAQIGDPPAVRLVEQRLLSDDPLVRRSGIELAGRTRSARLGRLLQRHLHKDAEELHAALEAAGDIGLGVDLEQVRRCGPHPVTWKAKWLVEVLQDAHPGGRLTKMIERGGVSGTFDSYRWALEQIRRRGLFAQAGPLRALHDRRSRLWVGGTSSFKWKVLDTIVLFGGRVSASEYAGLRDAGLIP